MRVFISAWLCVLLGLLPLEIQCRALTVQSHSHSPPASPLWDHHLVPSDAQLVWKALLLKDSPPFHPAQESPAVVSRGRRHVNSIGGKAHLMRVGCILGTCQVQNLSHRLYQLIGQSGREDSSPINPRSPHSYG